MTKSEKMKDCLKCICLKCIKEFKENPRLCVHSDCEWCENEPGIYTEICMVYEAKVRRQKRREQN